MDNELIIEKSWLKKNWIWIAIIGFLAIFISIVFISSNSKNGLSDTVTALNENSLYENAIKIANSNSEVLKTMGKIEAVDKLAILEGNTSYTDNKNAISLSVRINGSKKRGKLEIHAIKKGTAWDYQKIFIRTKNPKEEIIVLEKP
ncbi:cytochrome c oxidase assembly factor Coa1 family protein [Flavobacterium daemonense]|uniref:cytochrome c oxidase assembly factor Coa1 family protein n=1 Tax=Flavobacterium daemonense TaxID=1393049 RepID=UPI001184CBB7|nr:cytochrome c oxidase assembly factor Coa1 family protein [Flavobacterium daemonense]KAF2335639.1 hypothetical protein FND99_05615 [Flavobacterium daemonense]